MFLYILRVSQDTMTVVQLTLPCADCFQCKITMRRYPRLPSGIPRKRSKMPGNRSWMPTKLSGVARELLECSEDVGKHTKNILKT